jgi:hypothetical protein
MIKKNLVTDTSTKPGMSETFKDWELNGPINPNYSFSHDFPMISQGPWPVTDGRLVRSGAFAVPP